MADKMNIYMKIMKVREQWLEANVKKTGINRFAEFEYFELSDIVPVAQKLVAEQGLATMYDFDNEFAYLHVIDAEGEDRGLVTFKSPMRTLTVKGMNDIQALGAVITYQRRYLYMLFLDIVEQDEFDATSQKPAETPAKKTPAKKESATVKVAPAKKNNKPATPTQRKEAKKTLTDSNGEITPIQIQSIKTGLKKLRAEGDHEAYITEIAVKLKNEELTKTDAENVLITIGKKIAGEE